VIPKNFSGEAGRYWINKINKVERLLTKEDLDKSSRAWEEDLQGKEVMLVSFGSLFGGFEFFGATRGLDCDIIFLRDESKSWYMKGKGEFRTIPELVHWLEQKTKGYKKRVFIGNSMGGWAAALAGTLLEVDEVIAFCPQVSIDPGWRESIGDTRWSDSEIPKPGEEWSRYWNLSALIRGTEQTRYQVWYSPEDELDLKHAQLLCGRKSVQLNESEGGHYAARHLQKTGKLGTILREAVQL
jgi:hypothetical protein